MASHLLVDAPLPSPPLPPHPPILPFTGDLFFLSTISDLWRVLLNGRSTRRVSQSFCSLSNWMAWSGEITQDDWLRSSWRELWELHGRMLSLSLSPPLNVGGLQHGCKSRKKSILLANQHTFTSFINEDIPSRCICHSGVMIRTSSFLLLLQSRRMKKSPQSRDVPGLMGFLIEELYGSAIWRQTRKKAFLSSPLSVVSFFRSSLSILREREREQLKLITNDSDRIELPLTVQYWKSSNNVSYFFFLP